MESYTDWWTGLSFSLRFFWLVAIPFTVFFIIQLVASFLGGESPDDLPDAEIEADQGIGFQFFTLKNLVGFFTVFGWTGIACTESGLSLPVTILISVAGGAGMMLIMAGLFYLLMKANADGTMKFENAEGETGEVYLTIAANRSAVGKVQVKVTGVLRTLDAVTDDGEDLKNGQLVRVVKVLGNNILLVTGK
jgi:hypothetical protein